VDGWVGGRAVGGRPVVGACACVCMCVYVCVHAFVCACSCACVCVCVFVFVFVCVCVGCMYVQTRQCRANTTVPEMGVSGSNVVCTCWFWLGVCTSWVFAYVLHTCDFVFDWFVSFSVYLRVLLLWFWLCRG